MALFSRKNKTTEPKALDTVASVAVATDHNVAAVIQKPHITEKAVSLSDNRVYTFMVKPDATKHQVRDAVTALYNVTPVKVNIVKKAPKQVLSRTRGRVVSQKGYKKAYVYLKAGDTINLV